MTRPDAFTNTELDAGHYAQLNARDDRDFDYDEPGLPSEPDPHGVCVDEDCERLLCVLDRVIAEQKEEARIYAEYKASQRDEEAS